MERKITGQDGDDRGELIKSTFLPQYEDFSNIGAVKSSELLVDVDLKIQSSFKSANKSIFVLLACRITRGNHAFDILLKQNLSGEQNGAFASICTWRNPRKSLDLRK